MIDCVQIGLYIVGENEHNVSRLMTILNEQVEFNKSGFFFLRDPIPFDGTIVTVTASGYCAARKRKLHLLLADAITRSSTSIKILVNCTEVSYGDSNITIGRVEIHRRIAVTGGHYLGLKYTECEQNKTSTCKFVPAVDNDVEQQFVFIENNQLLQDNHTLKEMDRIGLQFSFTIEGGEPLYMHHNFLL